MSTCERCSIDERCAASLPWCGEGRSTLSRWPRSQQRRTKENYIFLSLFHRSSHAQQQHGCRTTCRPPSAACAACCAAPTRTPFRRVPFRLQRSEYSRESHEILATAGAPDAARVPVPARRITARARPWRGHLVPAVSIRGHRRSGGAVSKPRMKPHGSLTHPAAWAHRRGSFLADQRATAPPSPRGAAPRRPAARGRPLADVSRADR